ncbi:hypothetical protein Cgig2_006382 [Carnegiea gigantea]|uniref:Serine hydrolase domain-containing protein n=1 Tax=Carnegiea gigantea TaxID=171969 RepID=A0A9Q1K4U4_9CARY|nr:hypothetical protein Cgig2_006382 [Carnegiea gigantea]
MFLGGGSARRQFFSTAKVPALSEGSLALLLLGLFVALLRSRCLSSLIPAFISHSGVSYLLGGKDCGNFLHGFLACAQILKKQIHKWPDSICHKLDLVFIDALFTTQGKSDVKGLSDPPYYEWFQFNKFRGRHLQEFTEYTNFEKCLDYIEECMIKHRPIDGPDILARPFISAHETLVLLLLSVRPSLALLLVGVHSARQRGFQRCCCSTFVLLGPFIPCFPPDSGVSCLPVVRIPAGSTWLSRAVQRASNPSILLGAGHEHAPVISNHKSGIDWLVGWVLAQASNRLLLSIFFLREVGRRMKAYGRMPLMNLQCELKKHYKHQHNINVPTR